MPKLDNNSAGKYGVNNFRGQTGRNFADPINDMDAVNKRYAISLFARYDDLPPVPIISAKLGSTAPTLATFKGDIEQYTFDATNDYVIGSTEVIHTYQEGTDIDPHIHWTTNGTDTDARGVKWQLKYSIGNSNGAFTDQQTLTVDVPIPANTPDRTHFISEFTPDIDGTALKIGTYIVFRLERITSASTAPSANPFVIAVGFHILQDSAGSTQVYIK